MKITPIDKVVGALASADAIKFWLKCDEAKGARKLTDAVAGSTIAVSVVSSSAGQLDIDGVAGDTVVTGGLPAPGAGTDFALLAVIEKGAGIIGNMTYGVTTGPYISFGTAECKVKGAGGTSASLGAISGSGAQKAIIVADASGNTTLYSSAPGSALVAGAPVLYSSHGNLATTGDKFSFASAVGGTNMKLHGLMLLSFAGGALPANIVNICDWMMESWYDNNKAFYPPLEFV